MTKKAIKRAFIIAVSAFGVMLVAGITISILDDSSKRIAFTTFKDLIPLALGGVAAWLGYCVQRRSAYQQQLRTLWSRLVEAVHKAVQYTSLTSPNQEQLSEVLTRLSIAIDEVRGVFCNLDERSDDGGLYPFEPLKDILGLVRDLGAGDKFLADEARECQRRVFALWADVRRELLKEFDRDEPTFSHSHWADLEKARVYDLHEIPKRPS